MEGAPSYVVGERYAWDWCSWQAPCFACCCTLYLDTTARDLLRRGYPLLCFDCAHEVEATGHVPFALTKNTAART